MLQPIREKVIFLLPTTMRKTYNSTNHRKKKNIGVHSGSKKPSYMTFKLSVVYWLLEILIVKPGTIEFLSGTNPKKNRKEM